MTDKVLAFNEQVTAADDIQVIYTSPSSGNGTRVKAFTASNNTTTSVSYKGYIYNSAGVMVNAVIPMKIVVRDRFDTGTSVLNQIIPAGGTLRVECSQANSLNFYVSGLEQ